MKIIALDASTTSTGVAVFDDTELVYYTTLQPPSKLEWHERLVWQGQYLSEIIKKYSPTELVMEDVPLQKQGTKTLMMLGAVQGYVLGLASSFGLSMKYYFPNQWRSELGIFTGRREDTKREVLKQKAIELVNKKFNLELVWNGPNSKKSQDDVAEAILIGAVRVGAIKKRRFQS